MRHTNHHMNVMWKRNFIYAILIVALVLSAAFFMMVQKNTTTGILKNIYGDNYLHMDGEHFYVYKGVKVNLKGIDESLIRNEAQYELVYNGFHTMSTDDERNGMLMLDFSLVNNSDRTLTVTKQYSVEMEINGKWYICLAAGNASNSEKDDIFAGESITRSFGLAFRVITTDDHGSRFFMPFPPGRYRLLKEIDSQYIVLEFFIPESHRSRASI